MPPSPGAGTRLFRRLRFGWWRLTRGMTLGVRAVVLDDAGGVLLVRHGYARGWHFPGGGVDAGESLRGALERELLEEANVALTGEPALHGIFRQAAVSVRDHVAVFVVRDFSIVGPRPPDWEIAECRFFPRDALPEGTTAGTRARLAEIAAGKAAPIDW